MNLYFDITGNHNPDYPKDKVNASSTLMNAIRNKQKSSPGPLILFINNNMYVYQDDGTKLLQVALRTSRHNGFYEMTALSHIGVATAYYLKAKENGSTTWRTGLKTLLSDLKAVQTLNRETKNNWLDKVEAPSWQSFKPQIHNMVDYGCSLAGRFINEVLETGDYNAKTITKQFYERSDSEYPIPFNNIMITTFMLTVMETLHELDTALKAHNLDWANAKVIIRTPAGTNVTAGLSPGSNWLVPTMQALSRYKLPADRILITPYASIEQGLGDAQLPKATLSYYRDRVWQSIYDRTRIAKSVFSFIPDMYVADRPALPGDYGKSQASDISDFMIRLKYSLSHASEMLSNTVAFWMSGEFVKKDGDVSKITVPGLTVGFPKGIDAYPTNSPEVKS